MNETIETVAAAICFAGFGGRNNEDTATSYWVKVADSIKEEYRSLAKAAIEAMHHPTIEMCEAGVEAADSPDFIGLMAMDVWQAMIDSAIKGPNHNAEKNDA